MYVDRILKVGHLYLYDSFRSIHESLVRLASCVDIWNFPKFLCALKLFKYTEEEEIAVTFQHFGYLSKTRGVDDRDNRKIMRHRYRKIKF